MKLKYLCTIEGTNQLIRDKDSFKNHLSASNWLEIKEKNIFVLDSNNEKQEEIELKYELHQINNERSTFYILTVFSEQMDYLENFSKIFNMITNSIGIKSIILNDGISKFYSEKAYSKIHEIENLMREVITEFMSIVAGTDWTEETVSPIISKTDNKNAKKLDIDFLYERNFDQLSTFLFEEYSNYSTDQLISEVKDNLYKESVNVKSLEEILPKSNWDRFFKKHVKDKNIEETQIKKIWKNLYRYRNRIAHCNKFTKTDYAEFKKNVELADGILSKMIMIVENNIDVLLENKENIENIEKSYIASSNTIYSEFIKYYNEFLRHYTSITQENLESIDLNLEEKNSEPIVETGIKILKFKKTLETMKPSEEEVLYYIEEIKNVMDDRDVSLDWDTIIVPARKEGFTDVFLGKNQWYDLRIGKTKLDHIKYIAAYQTNPISAITYWAEVDKIVDSDNYYGYKKILFKGKAKELEHPIRLDTDQPTLAPQSIRYASLEKIKNAKKLSEVFK